MAINAKIAVILKGKVDKAGIHADTLTLKTVEEERLKEPVAPPAPPPPEPPKRMQQESQEAEKPKGLFAKKPSQFLSDMLDS